MAQPLAFSVGAFGELPEFIFSSLHLVTLAPAKIIPGAWPRRDVSRGVGSKNKAVLQKKLMAHPSPGSKLPLSRHQRPVIASSN